MAGALGHSLPGQQGCVSAGMTHTLVIHRKSFEFEDASSLQSLYPSSPTENGTESQPKFGSKSTLEENAYEDIVGKQGPNGGLACLWCCRSAAAGRHSQVPLHSLWADVARLLELLKERGIRERGLPKTEQLRD